MLRYHNNLLAVFALSFPPLLALSGCGSILPPCISEGADDKVQPRQNNKAVTADATQVLIGIDGSGSILGHARAADPSRWLSLLQSINLSTKTQGLTAKAFRVGGGKAQPLDGDSVTQATDPCFFEGCGSYPHVASSLQTLWDVQPAGRATPLRILVSDLEVNQSDISTLIGGIRKDLDKGSSVGVLAFKLPFEGQVFDTQGKPFYSGKLDRPIYLLATGNLNQVIALLEDVRKNMALKGVSTQEFSILDRKGVQKTMIAKTARPIPPNMGASGLNLRLAGSDYNMARNGDYRFVKLNPGSTGISVATTQPWRGGSTRPDLGLVRLERIPLRPGDSPNAGGIRIKTMSVAGSDVLLELDIPSSIPSGALRATIPRGSLPEQWWIDWDRSDPKAATAKEHTQGLLSLMTNISQLVLAENTKTPAVALCVAFQQQQPT